MYRSKKRKIQACRLGVLLLTVFVLCLLALYLGIPRFTDFRYQNMTASVATTTPLAPSRLATHVSTPSFVRGIYMTSCVAATPTLRRGLVKLIDETELNAVVMDIKSFDGHISFLPKDPILRQAVGGCFVSDMQDFIDELHDYGIYVIARMAVFQDHLMVKRRPDLAVKKASATSTPWKDYKGLSWIDASAKEHWDYTIALAREAHGIGFDEINFDYIRFPADGDMRDIWYPYSTGMMKSDVMFSFFKYLKESLSRDDIIISADLFGMTTTNYDDLNIGQVLEKALPYFDFISPMVYPSHYPKNFMNLGDPNEHVYEVVKISMTSAVSRTIASTTTIALPGARVGSSTPAVYAKPSFDKKKLRPWLQDNNYPVPYTAEMVKAQIQAAYDSGLDSWLLWNAGNRYTKTALEVEPLITP